MGGREREEREKGERENWFKLIQNVKPTQETTES